MHYISCPKLEFSAPSFNFLLSILLNPIIDNCQKSVMVQNWLQNNVLVMALRCFYDLAPAFLSNSVCYYFSPHLLDSNHINRFRDSV